MKTKNHMTRIVTCVSPTDSLQKAYDIMRDEEIRHLPVVVETNKLVGLLSERDVLLRARFEDGEIDVPDLDVEAAMTVDVVTCRPGSQLAEVAEIMRERRIDAVPVTETSGELVGIVTSADFVELALTSDRRDPAHHEPLPFDFTVNHFQVEYRAKKPADSLRPMAHDPLAD